MSHNPSLVTVLLIDDDHGFARLLEQIFEFEAPGVALVHADRLSTGLERLAGGGVNVTLLDLSLPDSWGIQTFSEAHALAQEVPIVVLSALADESLALEIVSKGAQDYLIKSQVNGPLLLRSLHYAIGRKKAERELRSSEANFRSVIERNADGIVILDHQGVVRFLNPAAETILDRKKEEVLGETFGFPVLAEETTEINIIRRSGSIGWAEMRLVEIVWESEPAYLAALHDVTERREMDRMKDEFVSVVSHELRTPLTAIRGSLGLVQNWVKGTQLAKTERLVDIAVTNTDRLGRLIDDFLDIERMESGQVTMEKRPCDVADLIEQSAELMRDMAENSGVTLVTSPLPACLWADPDRIMQILTNLLSNAIKFSSEGGTVELTAQPRGEHILFRVRDQGRGIPTDKLETIFERFEQVDASDSRSKGGTGLGLAICRSIAQQHDGYIWAESILGEGSTFFLTLPSLQEQRAEPSEGAA